MSLAVKPNRIKLTVLSAGLLGAILRAVLFATGVDEKGLLVSGHWADTSVWILTAAVALSLFLLLGKFQGAEQYEVAFPKSILRATGCILAACGILLSSAPEGTVGNLALAELVMRLAAALALVALGYCRFSGRKPLCLLHGALCLFLALRMICLYRLWSADPQLQNYCFSLGAHVALMLTAYQLAAFDAGLANPRILWCSGLSAVYLCMLALADSQPFLMLCCGIWVLTNLSAPGKTHKKSAYIKEEA